MDETVLQNNNVLEDDSIQFQRETEDLEESNREKEQRIRKMEAKAAQNLNLYFIFQAVILLSTATATSLSCHHWWLPFILSLLAALQNFFGFSRTMIRVRKLREELDQDLLDLGFMKMYRITGAQVKRAKPGSKVENDEEIVRPKLGLYCEWRGRLLSYCPMVLFVVFSGLVMYGCYILVCHNNGGKCVKLC